MTQLFIKKKKDSKKREKKERKRKVQIQKEKKPSLLPHVEVSQYMSTCMYVINVCVYMDVC